VNRPRAKVVRAIDGDTLWLRVRVRLRTSSPGASAKGGPEATARTAARYQEGADVTFDPRIVDSYGRFISTLTPDRRTD